MCVCVCRWTANGGGANLSCHDVAQRKTRRSRTLGADNDRPSRGCEQSITATMAVALSSQNRYCICFFLFFSFLSSLPSAQ